MHVQIFCYWCHTVWLHCTVEASGPQWHSEKFTHDSRHLHCLAPAPSLLQSARPGGDDEINWLLAEMDRR